MSERFPGGFITKAPVAPTSGAASGIWTIDQAMQYIKAGTWPTPQYDPYFNYVTALLTGDGTNGAQNNTFLDSSTNNFTITRNGNTTQGTFSPFSQTGWSNYFSSSYITQSSSITFGTNSYTIEFWVNQSSRGSSPNWFDGVFSQTSGAVRQYIDIGGGEHNWVVYDGSTRQVNINLGTLPPLNTWTHYALVRNGNTFTAYINGVQVGTTTSTYSIPAMAIQIGWVGTSDGYLNGYISNFRAVNGTAVYTSAFTPPTSPLTAITNTALLTCQSNRFLDNSSNAFTFTVTGSPSVQAFSPFNPTSAWSASSNGGSGYFDGSGDYLTGTAPNLSGTWTVEFWWYPTAGIATQQTIVSFNAGSNTGINIWCNTSGQLVVDDGANAQTAFSTVTFKANQWNHVAIVRSGTTTTGYINGAVAGSNTFTPQTTNAIFVGRYNGGTAYYVSGFVADVRVVNGTAVYTAAFTPPTAPLTAITNTQVLLNFTNAGIYDNAAVDDYETVGNAQVSTAVKKYGTGSMYFDGTGDWLAAPVSDPLKYGTGDLTIEGWFYNSAAQQAVSGLFSYLSGATYFVLHNNTASYPNQLTLWVDAYSASPVIIGGVTTAQSAWYHFALNRTAGIWKLYLNGTQIGSSYTNSAEPVPANSQFRLGLGNNSGGAGSYTGYIDDFRITKGVGRYPYNFTPPTSALMTSSGGTPPSATSDLYYRYTTLLLPGNGTNGAQNNTFLDSSTNNFTITRNGNTTQGNFSPFSQTGWSNNFVRSSSSYLSVSGNNVFNFSLSDWTVEAWVNLASMPTSNDWPASWSSTFVLACTGTPSGGDGFNCIIGSTQIFIQVNDTKYGSAVHGMTVGQWNHLAYTRSGNTLYFFVNGNLMGTASFSGSVGTGSGTYIGCETGQGAFFDGYISNLRVVKNAALYTASFTPPTAPLTTTVSSGTVSLLTCQNNRFLDNSSNALAFTASNNPSVQAFSPFAPTAAWSASTNGGSGYFDGSGDYLSVPVTSSVFTLNGDFTIEAWIYRAPSSYMTIFDTRSGGNYTDYVLGANTSGQIDFVTAGGAGVRITTTETAVANSWTHVACVRQGSTIKVYLNGVASVNTVTYATTLTPASTTGFIGGSKDPVYSSGYATDVRITKGAALYTANFTPPTAPLTTTVSSGTVSLLVSNTNGAITDATAKNNLETVGNAQISTTQSKFGGSSMYFDGTGDYLLTQATAQLMQIGSGDFTVEAWIYIANTTAGKGIVDFRTGSADATGFYFGTNGAQLQIYSQGVITLSAGTISANTWTHVACVRYSGTINLYINGVSVGSSANTTNWSQTGACVGASVRGAGENFNGYIDDLRITKGIARYTSNFTPPTSAFLTQ